MAIVDLKRLAELNSISVSTLRKFIKIGMPVYRPGRKYYADTSEIKKWLKQHRVEISDNIQHIDIIIKNVMDSLKA